MTRRVLALLALALLVGTSGCLSAITGPQDLPADRLDRKPAEPYAWDSGADVHVTVQPDATFQAVYNLSNPNASEPIELYRRNGIGGKNPLDVRSVRYRYPNGTVINGSQFAARGGDIKGTGDAVVVTPPGEDGQLAFTAGSTPKRFALPVYVEGSYEVVLPTNREADLPVFGQISPSPDRTEVVDGRTHIYWDSVTTRSVIVQFYVQRDVGLFAALVALVSVVAVGGLFYYRRQIERLREQREELGLDVDTDGDEFDDGPPPGMR